MKNLYEAGAPSVEAQRLESFDWPNQVSRSIIETINYRAHINSLLDAGAGPGTGVARICAEFGIAYTGFDNGLFETGPYRISFAEKLRGNLNYEGLRGASVFANVLDVGLDSFYGLNPDPRNNDLYDVAHMRFVQMHLGEIHRDIAVINLLKLAKKRVILMEYDWQSVASSTHPELIQECVSTVENFAKLVNLDIYCGRSLANAEQSFGFPTNYAIYSRPEGPFAAELLSKLPTCIQVSKQLGHEELSEQLMAVSKKITAVADRMTLIPAEIHSAVIDTSVPRKPLV